MRNAAATLGSALKPSSSGRGQGESARSIARVPGTLTPALSQGEREHRRESALVRRMLISSALLVVGVFIVAPVALVFYAALENGFTAYWKGLISNPATLHSIKLTLIVAPIAVVLNTIFGVAAAWLIARFRFPGRTALVSLIDLPFSVSPVVVGLMLMLLFGRLGFLGPWLQQSNIHIVFALPGIVLATMFVTLPFVARELIPVMEAIGGEEETAAISLGANARQMFWRVTLPNIKWGLLYGIILCNARAMGEFGAVYVVSGRDRKSNHDDASASTKTLGARARFRRFCVGFALDAAWLWRRWD